MNKLLINILNKHKLEINDSFENSKNVNDFILDIETILDDEDYFDPYINDTFLKKLNKIKTKDEALKLINKELSIKKENNNDNNLISEIKLRNFKDNVVNIKINNKNNIIDAKVINTKDSFIIKYKINNTIKIKSYDSLIEVNKFLNKLGGNENE